MPEKNTEAKSANPLWASPDLRAVERHVSSLLNVIQSCKRNEVLFLEKEVAKLVYLFQSFEGVKLRGIELDKNTLQQNLFNSEVPIHRYQEDPTFWKPLKARFCATIFPGPSARLGGFERVLWRLASCVHSGGYLFVGDWYWRRTPSPRLLNAFGAWGYQLKSLPGNLQFARELGFSSRWWVTDPCGPHADIGYVYFLLQVGRESRECTLKSIGV